MAANTFFRFQLLSPVKAGVYADVTAYVHGRANQFFLGLRPLPPSGANYPAKWIKEGKYSPWTEMFKSGFLCQLPRLKLGFAIPDKIRDVRRNGSGPLAICYREFEL
jgi:hypothetical protein